jgi:hypothetical protein
MATSPSEEEMAAIVAAYEVLHPRVVVLAEVEGAAAVPAWRFSGRWWSRPIPSRRMRPWT